MIYIIYIFLVAFFYSVSSLFVNLGLCRCTFVRGHIRPPAETFKR